MKKLFMLLCALTMVFGLVGYASAASFTEVIGFGIFEGILDEHGDTYGYSHSTPAGFSVPPDHSVSATLKILSYYGDDSDDTVAVDTFVGTLTAGGGIFSGPATSLFDISASFFPSWSAKAPLDILITAAGGSGWIDIIKLHSSTLTLSWTDGTDTAPVPEPATILLMGVGLLGLVAYSRKRFSKKS